MTFQYRYRKQILLGIVLLLLLLVPLAYFFFFLYKKTKKKEIVEEVKLEKKEEKKQEIDIYKVDIKGEVNTPGIYSLTSDSRVIDVIEKAGGLTEQADTSVINLSKKINDEMVIIIYSEEEVREFEKTKEKEKQVEEKCIQKDDNSLKNDACITTNTMPTGKVNINTASKEELMTLNGIGEAKANDIIKYRETNGNFETIEDIKKIEGIGDSIFAKIQEDITV